MKENRKNNNEDSKNKALIYGSPLFLSRNTIKISKDRAGRLLARWLAIGENISIFSTFGTVCPSTVCPSTILTAGWSWAKIEEIQLIL